ncbi:hypothetical protein KY333_02750 [Candidatus Woesearchaeota archaeon]|nr:hypothetical protein [Candidatus Woesearchaeota archaeon]
MFPKNYYGFDIIHTKDDELEERIVNFLNPILLELENTLEPCMPKDIAQLHDAEVLKRIQP